MAKIYFVCPDFDYPSSGVRRLYRYVHRLRERGMDAVVVHVKHGFRTAWHGIDVPVEWLSDQPVLNRGDVLVLPETGWKLLESTSAFQGERVVMALNWAYALRDLPPGKIWPDVGVHRAFTVSRVIAGLLEWGMGLDVTVIDNWLDPALYHANDAAKKENFVVYLARKGPYAEFLQRALKRRSPLAGDWQWHGLLNHGEEDYAGLLRRARVYLATGTEEGFPSAPVEAMACACLVVGFNGVGGAEFMRGEGPRQNCILIENGDYPGLGAALEEVLPALVTAPERYAHIIANGRATAAGFTDPGKESDQLEAYFRKLLESSASKG